MILEKSVESRKSTQHLDAPDKIKNTLFTNQVMTVFLISPGTSTCYASFSRPTNFSRMIRLLASLCLVLVISCEQPEISTHGQNSISVTTRLGSTPDPGFARALGPRDFNFPADHGAHPEFATEWWYFTGNLRTSDGERFGYQLTLFRVGLKPGPAIDDSDWRSHQFYMGHLAISDIDRQQHVSHERFSRSAAGLAGAENGPLKIWLGPWSIKGSETNLFPLQLTAATDAFAIDLTLQAGSKSLVLQGDRGLSRKGGAPGNASYYYSYTRLPTSGVIRLAGRDLPVEGDSWFDREWSSSALADDQAGWDWFSLQLEDGRDLMFYRMRDRQGQAQIYSRGVLVKADGSVQALSLENTQLEATDTWRSADGAPYPIGWRLQIPDYQIDLHIEAAFEDQEMRLTVQYWEGAVNVSGSHNGVGYLELSGYTKK